VFKIQIHVRFSERSGWIAKSISERLAGAGNSGEPVLAKIRSLGIGSCESGGRGERAPRRCGTERHARNLHLLDAVFEPGVLFEESLGQQDDFRRIDLHQQHVLRAIVMRDDRTGTFIETLIKANIGGENVEVVM